MAGRAVPHPGDRLPGQGGQPELRRQLDGSQGGYTYGDFPTIGGAPEVHSSGEVWAQTLWDLRERFGHSYALSLITRAMELSPNDPSMLDMRNAILQADLVANGGKNAGIIWTVFANRGMGWYAGSSTAATRSRRRTSTEPPTGATTTLSGTVKDKDTGAPVAGALVYVGGHSSGYAGDYSDATDATGKFTIAGVAPGTYPKVVVSAPGYELIVQPVTVKPARHGRLRAAPQLGGRIRRWFVVDYNGPDFTPSAVARAPRSTTHRAPAGAAPLVTTLVRRPTSWSRSTSTSSCRRREHQRVQRRPVEHLR